MQPERRVRPKVEERVGGANCQRTFPSILANAKNLRGFGGLVPHVLTNSYPFSNFTFWNSRDHTALQFTLNQNTKIMLIDKTAVVTNCSRGFLSIASFQANMKKKTQAGRDATRIASQYALCYSRSLPTINPPSIPPGNTRTGKTITNT